MRTTLGLALLLWGVVGCDSEALPPLVQGLGPVEHVLVRDVSLFTGLESELRRDIDVELKDGRIHAVRPTGAPPPEGARVIAGEGRTLLPGLVDTHVHITAPLSAPPWHEGPAGKPAYTAGALLYAGVTTAYDLSGMSAESRALRENIEAGDVAGPRLFLTDMSVSAKGGHPAPAAKALAPFPLSLLVDFVLVQVDGPEDAAAAVKRVKDEGVDYLKIIYDDMPPGSPMLSPGTLKALIDEGHRQELFVLVHPGTARTAVEAARAGADALAHMPHRDELSQGDAEVIAAEGTPVIATLHGFAATAALAEGRHATSALGRRMYPQALWSACEGEDGRGILETPVVSDVARSFVAGEPSLGENIRALSRAGVPILVGTDSPLPCILPGASLHEELRELVERGGVAPAAALQGATAKAARLFQPRPEFGSIEIGKVADVLLVEGDPLADIRATANIVAVFKGGREVLRTRPADDAAPTQNQK